MKEFNYCYEMSMNVNSKTEQVVFDDSHEKMFTLRRFNKNIIDKVLAYREPKSCVNVSVKDILGNSKVTVTESWSFKRKFTIKCQSNSEQISARASPQLFETSLNSETYSFVKNGDNVRELYVNNQKALESITIRKGLSLNNYIKIYNEEIDIKLAIACLHAFIIAY